MSHTPGPWTANHNIVATTRGRLAIDCGMSGATDAEDCANARLVAAAPELLAALKALVDVDEVTAGTYEMAESAIAKAEGR